eukprot:TRINITY_DN7500_c0_g1_i1.p1 TRINITY_DN7500_c0_g1~~TRINITY_DN7500_c0_g1_i1.p1  ORF type:complete len:197 (+),score=40.59 TRINITY_DN7500_c0_g1_i1:96-686(+)
MGRIANVDVVKKFYANAPPPFLFSLCPSPSNDVNLAAIARYHMTARIPSTTIVVATGIGIVTVSLLLICILCLPARRRRQQVMASVYSEAPPVVTASENNHDVGKGEGRWSVDAWSNDESVFCVLMPGDRQPSFMARTVTMLNRPPPIPASAAAVPLTATAAAASVATLPASAAAPTPLAVMLHIESHGSDDSLAQ